MRMWPRWWSCCRAAQINGTGWPGGWSSLPPLAQSSSSSPRRQTVRNWLLTWTKRATAWASCTETWTRVKGTRSSATLRKRICLFWWQLTLLVSPRSEDRDGRSFLLPISFLHCGFLWSTHRFLHFIVTFSCFLFVSLPSSWSGHSIHSHSGELRRGTRHRHAHAQDWPNWSRWREGYGLHSPHQQRHHFCRWPREKSGGSESICFQRTDGLSHAGEMEKVKELKTR